jgi:hypothetical protein
MHVLAGKDGSGPLVRLLKPFVREDTLRGIDREGRQAWEIARTEEVREMLKP